MCTRREGDGYDWVSLRCEGDTNFNYMTFMTCLDPGKELVEESDYATRYIILHAMKLSRRFEN